MEEKIKLTFLKHFDNPLSKYLTFKRISCMQWLFWVFYQNKKGVWDQLLVHIFRMVLPYKCFLFNTLSTGKVSMSYFFSFPRYQTKCVIKFLCRQLMMSQTIRFILDQPLKQWLTRRNRGEDGNTKIWISREWKELFRWNKIQFSYFLKGYYLVKNKKWWKIADTSFKNEYMNWADHFNVDSDACFLNAGGPLQLYFLFFRDYIKYTLCITYYVIMYILQLPIRV